MTLGFIQQKEKNKIKDTRSFIHSMLLESRDYGNGEISVGCKL